MSECVKSWSTVVNLSRGFFSLTFARDAPTHVLCHRRGRGPAPRARDGAGARRRTPPEVRE